MRMNKTATQTGLILTTVFLAVLLVTVVGVGGYLQSKDAQNRIQTLINRNIKGDLSFQAMTISVWHRELTLHKVHLTDVQHHPVLEIHSLYARLNLWAVLNKALIFEHIKIERPNFNLIRLPSGVINIVDAIATAKVSEAPPEKSTLADPLTLHINEINLIDGTLQWIDIPHAIRFETSHFNIKGHVKGNLTDPSAELNAIFTEASFNGHPIAPVTANANLRNRQLQVSLETISPDTGRLAIEATTYLNPLFPKGFLARPENPSAPGSSLRLKAEQWNPQGLALPINGAISGTLSLSSTGIDPRQAEADLTFALSGNDLINDRLPAPVSAKLSGQVRLEKGTVSTDQINAQIADTHMVLSGHYRQRGGDFEVFAHIDAPELSKPLLLARVDNISGRLQLHANARGTIDKPTASVDLAGRGIQVGQYPLGDLAAKITLSPDHGVHIENLSIKHQTAHVTGQAHIPWQDDLFTNPAGATGTASLDFVNLDLGGFLPPKIITGIIDGHLTATGNFQQPDLSLEATGRKMSTMGYPLGAVQTRARFQQGRLHVAPLIADYSGTHAEVNGDVWLSSPEKLKWIGDPRFDLKLSGRNIELNAFLNEMSGQVSLDASVRGPWSSLNGEGDLQAKNLDFGFQKVAALATPVRLADNTIFMEAAQLRLSEQSLLSATGWIAFDGRFDAVLDTPGVVLTDIDRLQTHNRIQGLLSGTLQCKGLIANPDVNGQLNLSGMQINDIPLNDTDLTLSLVQRQLTLKGRQTGLNLQGQYHFSEHRFDATLSASGLRLTPYLSALGKKKLSGSLSGEIALSGDSEALSQLQADISIKEIELATPRLKLLRTAPFEARFYNGRLTVPNLQVSFLDQGDLNIQGQGGLEGSLDFKAHGQIPFAALELFTSAVAEPAGTLHISARLTGTAHDPLPVGEIRLDNLSGIVPALNQRLSAVIGTLHITEEAVSLKEPLSAMLDTGRLSVDGDLQLTGLQPRQLNLNLTGYQLPLTIPETMELTANTNLQLRGDWQQAKMSGNVDLIEGLYHKDLKLNLLNTLSGIATELVRKKRVTTARTPSLPDNPFLKNLWLDITVGYRNPIEVANNLAELSVAPDLRIQGNLYPPVITGRAVVEEGVVNYQNNRFIIKRGIIDFINPRRTQPEFDIDSEVTVRQWLIGLKVTGPPDALEFELSSQPPEDDQDILSLLLSGKTYSELIEGEGGSSQATASMLADLIISRYGDTIKDVTGVDIIETAPGDMDNEGQSSVKVTLGKNLTRRMQIKYDLEDRGGEFQSRTSAEYRFIENIFLSGFQENSGVFGGALTYRLEFR